MTINPDRAWRLQAACARKGTDLTLFFHEPHNTNTKEEAERDAKAICATCPVQPECLAAALADDEQGIWGGTTEQERARMPGRRGPGRGAMSKTSGYLPFHRRGKIDLCACGLPKTSRATRCSVCVRTPNLGVTR